MKNMLTDNNIYKKDFLLEIGCEELPAAAQLSLPAALSEQISRAFLSVHLTFDHIKTFATPRRLAILVSGLSEKQLPIEMERQGPSFDQAYDKNGSPTLACFGFAKSCDTSIDQLIIKETPRGKRVICISKKPGKNTSDLLPDIIPDAIQTLPLPKSMRWNNSDVAFIRPVHWVVMLLGDNVIPAKILGHQTTHHTQGHRFHHPKSIHISKPEDYNILLYSQGFVIADFEARKKRIEKLIHQIVGENNIPLISDKLLNEVTALVEWPVVLKGVFDKRFLSIPKEILISAMEKHQKCFPVVNDKNELQPCFLLVSNIESKNPEMIIKGNERVIRARLSDAEFFYHQDIKQKLIDHLPMLDHLVFQDQLGSVGDKTKRLVQLSTYIAKKIGADVESTKRAALLSKCDLVSDVVGEFPDLQGIMGYYYALHDQESELCATAIQEHYFPKFSGDQLPGNLESCALALADRLDTLVGIFGIHQLPTGDKDPLGLKRAAQGILRISIEKNVDLDLSDLLKEAENQYALKLPNKTLVQNVLDFMMARLKSSYIEKGISPEIFEAVLACQSTSPLDFDKRVRAVLQFQTLPESSSLAAANKRVSNILKKEGKQIHAKKTNAALFECDAEKNLARELTERTTVVEALYQQSDYTKALSELSVLKKPIDQFFDEVMIMVKDEKIRQNRLALLVSIRELFTKVADISMLP